jgi:cellulose synthase/poly-beta-1,6-N-acetylglucosamine synthase-like glycosyltransferase
MINVMRVLRRALECWVGTGLLYHYLLLLAGGARSCTANAQSPLRHRLAVVVPAHNEQAVIGRTVGHLLAQRYPRTQYDVHVVADHCEDDTANVARLAGAEVHVRTDTPCGRKGYALAWGLQRLLADPRDYDAFVIFDADSRPDPDCLAELQQALAKGVHSVQGRHVIANPDASLFAALADADMRLNNRIRNQAKTNLRLSARLMGDAMCFQRDVLTQHPWVGAGSLTEDREYGIYLVTQGEHIAFAVNAVSFGQSTTSWQSATPQRMRWYGGAFALQKRYVAPLTARCIGWLDADAFDKLLELLLPPFSMMAVLSPLLVAMRLLTKERSMPGLALWGASWLFPVVGLILERAPRTAYRALLIGPFYVMWRLWIGVRVRWRRAPIAWVRTQHR